MRTLLRLAGWGFAATVAMVVAIVAAQTSSGQQRVQVAIAALTGKSTVQVAKADAPKTTATAPPVGPAAKAVPDPVQLARLAATESETRQLTEMVRSLNVDRERLLARLAAVERNLEDVTGSIQKQAMPLPTPEPPAIPAPVLAEPPATTAPPQNDQPADAVAPSPEQVATVAPSATSAEPEPSRRPAIGAEIGSATNFDGLRTLWNATRSAHLSLFEGLHPVVGVRENSKTRAADLRLLVGPLADVEAVAKMCAALAAGKRTCRLAVFEGQPLALAVPAPVRRAKAPERKAAPPPPPPVFPNP